MMTTAMRTISTLTGTCLRKQRQIGREWGKSGDHEKRATGLVA